MPSLHDQTVVVAGASGNVAPFVVRALLERGACVAAPSRSEEKLQGLRELREAWGVRGVALEGRTNQENAVNDELDEIPTKPT
jgi:NADP-dependent 3-hydroxy acid dehydrogenase YdfG